MGAATRRVAVALALAATAAAAETQVLRNGRGGVVARVPVSRGAHGGVVAAAAVVADDDDEAGRASPIQRPQDPPKRAWIAQTVSAEGQKSALKDVHMAPLMASEVFVVGEGGVVLKANVSQGAVGTETFETIRNEGFPNYYYGVFASEGGVLVSGFVDGAGGSKGVTTASFDAGATWQPAETVDGKTWLGGPIRCTNATHCVVPGVSSNKMYVTENGVASVAADWTTVVPDPKVGWFSGPFVADSDSVVVTGLGLCNSTDGGLNYGCRHSVDPTFDGGIALQLASAPGEPAEYGRGLVGGGEISTPVSGWVHSTSDGPAGNWTKRDLKAPYPIRWVGFFGEVALAVGGDYNAGLGGIHSSVDGGETWALDLDTGVEMSACSGTSRDFSTADRSSRTSGGSMIVTCVGSARGKSSVIVSTLLEIGK
jgi:hypothetical protein